MAPGALSILAPLLGKKAKRYEKLQTEDPDKRKKEEASPEEVNRLNMKIGKLVSSLTKEQLDLATGPDNACLVCCRSKATMLLSPCNHQSLCRLCFVHRIQDAVASRDLPLRCMVCNAKIFKVKNNHLQSPAPADKAAAPKCPPAMPTSVSGYSLYAATTDPDTSACRSAAASSQAMAMSSSSYSMASALSSISSSSFESNRSVRSSSASIRSSSSLKSSSPSWFSLGSLTSFQAGGITDSQTISRPPRAHSLSSRGKIRAAATAQASSKMCSLPSSYSVKSWTAGTETSKRQGQDSKHWYEPRISLNPRLVLATRDASGQPPVSGPLLPPQSTPLSPHSIDERIRAVQLGIRTSGLTSSSLDNHSARQSAGSDTEQDCVNNNSSSRRPTSRSSFRQPEHLLGQGLVPAGPQHSRAPDNLNIDNSHGFKGQLRRLSGSGRFSKSPDLNESTFSMSTIEEEQEVALSMKNLAAA